MNKVIIIRWGEIFLKGKNKGHFEKMLEQNIQKSLSEFDLKFLKVSGRYLIKDFDENITEDIITKLSKISGIYSISLCDKVSSNFDEIKDKAVEISKDLTGTFKVETNRADKRFPMLSTEISAKIGGAILKENKNLKVDIHAPQTTINIDIRESGETFLFTDTIKMMGGMPSGTAGRGLLLISGGIDSPVAGYMIAKRGMKLEALHFHSYPYTSDMAREKVLTLAKKVADYTAGMKVNIVSLTQIQEEIHKNCKEEYMITIMRRFMFKIAEIIAKNNNLQAIITGESLGQVASQTIESITSSNSVITMPVLRPLIAFDKIDIIKISESIDTYETSILPYEDCCTVFLPKHPLIKPNLKSVLLEESKLDVEKLISDALLTLEVVEI